MASDAVESKKKPYRPGEASRNYFRLPPVKREAIRGEVNRRFRAETGVTRDLDPTSKADLELRRIWLRMRDEASKASLNLSTYIALYTYGYDNVYELGPLVDIHASKLAFDSCK